MKTRIVSGGMTTLACCVMLSAGASARELGAHQHGHGTVNIAIEDSVMWVELVAPGADIVGFEHEASSDEDKAAIEDAKATLADPLAIMSLPEAAGCTPQDANVEIETEAHHHGEENDEHDEGAHDEEHHDDEDHDDEHHDEAHHDDDNHDGEHHDEDEAHGGHSEFHVEYSLTCANPAAIDSITFDYFDLFPGAKELDVTLLTDHGQNHYEVTPDAPTIDVKH